MDEKRLERDSRIEWTEADTRAAAISRGVNHALNRHIDHCFDLGLWQATIRLGLTRVQKAHAGRLLDGRDLPKTAQPEALK